MKPAQSMPPSSFDWHQFWTSQYEEYTYSQDMRTAIEVLIEEQAAWMETLFTVAPYERPSASALASDLRKYLRATPITEEALGYAMTRLLDRRFWARISSSDMQRIRPAYHQINRARPSRKLGASVISEGAPLLVEFDSFFVRPLRAEEKRANAIIEQISGSFSRLVDQRSTYIAYVNTLLAAASHKNPEWSTAQVDDKVLERLGARMLVVDGYDEVLRRREVAKVKRDEADARWRAGADDRKAQHAQKEERRLRKEEKERRAAAEWVRKNKPAPLEITDWITAELNALSWMHYLGFSDAKLTRRGADGGIDIFGTGVVAPVKNERADTGRPALQRLVGAARAHVDVRRQLFFLLLQVHGASHHIRERSTNAAVCHGPGWRGQGGQPIGKDHTTKRDELRPIAIGF